MPKSNKNDIRPTKANDSISSDKYEFSNNKDKKKKDNENKKKIYNSNYNNNKESRKKIYNNNEEDKIRDLGKLLGLETPKNNSNNINEYFNNNDFNDDYNDKYNYNNIGRESKSQINFNISEERKNNSEKEKELKKSEKEEYRNKFKNMTTEELCDFLTKINEIKNNNFNNNSISNEEPLKEENNNVINSSENKKANTYNDPNVPSKNINRRNNCCCDNILGNKIIGSNEGSNSNKLNLDNNNGNNFCAGYMGLMTGNKELCGYGDDCNDLPCDCLCKF